MPPKPIANAGCDTTLILCKKLTFQIKIYSQTRVYLVPFIQNFPEEIYIFSIFFERTFPTTPTKRSVQ